MQPPYRHGRRLPGTAALSTGTAIPYPCSARPVPAAVWSTPGNWVWRGAARRTSAALLRATAAPLFRPGF
eukprot:7544310-Heterocapsa_arctica.AAC.1